MGLRFTPSRTVHIPTTRNLGSYPFQPWKLFISGHFKAFTIGIFLMKLSESNPYNQLKFSYAFGL